MTIAGILLAATVMAKPSGALFINGMGVARCEAGVWKSLGSALATDPQQNAIPAMLKKFHQRGTWALSKSTVQKASFGEAVFGDLDNPPGERGWFIDPFDKHRGHWIGDKPSAADWKEVSPKSATYLQIARSYIRTKGYPKANPFLHDVILTDFDGDGIGESLIIGGSRERSKMYVSFQGNVPTRKPNDYSFAILRRLAGGKIQTKTVYFSDGRSSGVEGMLEFVGAWNLDGGRETEFILNWRGYEAWSSSVYRLVSGNLVKLAEAGDGA